MEVALSVLTTVVMEGGGGERDRERQRERESKKAVVALLTEAIKYTDI